MIKPKEVVLLLLMFICFNLVSSEDATLSPSNVSVVVDAYAPEIIILSPLNITYSVSNPVLVNYTINDLSLDSIWYSLNNTANVSISNPFYLNLGEGEYHLVIYANDSFSRMNFSEVYFSVSNIAPFCGDSTCNIGEDCSSCPEDCGICQTPRDDGSSGGESEQNNFQISPNEISISMSKGENKTTLISITNTGDKNLHITTEISSSLQDFINLKEEEFDLMAGKEKIFGVEFVTPKTYTEDIYVGTIFFKGGGVERPLLILLEVESLDSLFDLKINVLDKIIWPGKELRSEVEILDVGRIGSTKIEIEFLIKDSNGNTIIEKKETKTIENELKYTEILQLSKNISEGEYVLSAKIVYNGKTAIASDTFEIKKQISLWPYLILIILAILLCYLYYKRKKPKKIKIQSKRLVKRDKKILEG